MSGNAAIFPGQGAQEVGMGQDVFAACNVAAETFAAADQVLGFELSKLCFEGPADRLNATDIQQPAIFTTSVALFRAALDRGLLKADQFAAMGGLSLGEYTALHLAGALSFEAALRLVYRRGQLMQQACEASPGGMVSLMGMNEEQVLALCERVQEHGRVGPANFNCPGQIVISGDRAACTAATGQAEAFGGRAIPLDVAGAFHSELMRPAAEALRETLAASEFQTPRVRVITNVNAEYHGDPASIRDALYQQVFNPVRWHACVERLVADGCDAFWEVGPKRVLAGLMRKINRQVKTSNVGKLSDLG
ncbi:MAG: ACP S-malonyltransferase [Phycisphaerae bacterium]|jgi:[acyl-carrier-protein] S-malonyltransferase